MPYVLYQDIVLFLRIMCFVFKSRKTNTATKYVSKTHRKKYAVGVEQDGRHQQSAQTVDIFYQFCFIIAWNLLYDHQLS